jgi:threonine/homoserine/homoserine lactone efflux protein
LSPQKATNLGLSYNNHCGMLIETLTALVAFAFVSSVTPGPNNLMLMASGANYGFARSMPHMLGIALGFTLMIVLVGAGLVQLFDAWPPSYTILKILSVVYMTWLAWKIARAAPVEKSKAAGTPMTFMQAAAFQWVNPKAWAMALTALSVYATDASLAAFVLVAAVFGLVNLPSIALWTIMGQQMARLLTNPARLRAFNWTMAALLVASLYPVLWPA